MSFRVQANQRTFKLSNQWPEWMALNKNLRELTPYGAPQIPAQIRLNTNENPYPLRPEIQEQIISELSANLAALNRYPDRDALKLRELLAQYINENSNSQFTRENIWVANGSNEILQSICLAFEGDAMGFEPSYSMHPLISRSVGKHWYSIPRTDEFEIDINKAVDEITKLRPGVVFIATPNNPTGSSVSITDIEKLAKAALEVKAVLVVDEAYAEFSSQTSAVSLISGNPNLIVSRTMSKAFGFAGVRVGYLVAAKAVIDAMLLVRLPYHLSELTQAAARAAIGFSKQLKEQVNQIKQSRDKVASELGAMGLKVFNSDANFLLFTGFKMSSQELWRQLVSEGVLIRDVGIPGHLRVTIGTEFENEAFLKALKQITQN